MALCSEKHENSVRSCLMTKVTSKRNQHDCNKHNTQAITLISTNYHQNSNQCDNVTNIHNCKFVLSVVLQYKVLVKQPSCRHHKNAKEHLKLAEECVMLQKERLWMKRVRQAKTVCFSREIIETRIKITTDVHRKDSKRHVKH